MDWGKKMDGIKLVPEVEKYSAAFWEGVSYKSVLQHI